MSRVVTNEDSKRVVAKFQVVKSAGPYRVIPEGVARALVPSFSLFFRYRADGLPRL